MHWYYNTCVDFYNEGEDYLDNYQFIHNFYGNNTVNSEYIKLLYPIIDKIKPSRQELVHVVTIQRSDI